MKKIIVRYVFTVAVILCLMSSICGIIAVKEKTQYNMDMSPYDTASIEKRDDGVVISLGERETFIDRDIIEKMGKKAFYAALGDVFVRFGNILEKNAL